MEEPRTSLWSRLVVFYSVNKRDQLNPEVMAEIVAKYGSKEKELSARLLKKYGRPLPPSVPARDLRRVLLEFGMEDQDTAGGAGPATAAAAAAAVATATADRTSAEGARRAPARQAPEQEGQTGHGERQAERPPRGSELNFRSKFFDPLQALNHETLRPPFPRERALDNLAKFQRIMPKLRTATPTATGTTATTGGATVGTGARAGPNPPPLTTATPRDPAAATTGTTGASDGVTQPGVKGELLERGAATASARSSSVVPESAAAAAAAAAAAQGGPINERSAGKSEGGTNATGGGQTTSRRGAGGESGVGGSIGGHYGPPVGSAAELDRIDKEMASKRRSAGLLLAGGGAGAAVSDEERYNPAQRIMREYAGTGPYSLLYRLHEDKRRASVMIRRVNSIRGTCTGLIRAFDKHMNMLLVDVREDYTAFVPARDPKPRRSRPQQERRTQDDAPSPNPPRETGTGAVEEDEEGSRGKPADVGGDTGPATLDARGSSSGVGGAGGAGGWSGGGSVSWGVGGGGGVEEVKGLSHPSGTAAGDADGRRSVLRADELEAGGGVGGGVGGSFAVGGAGGAGDRGAVAPAAGFSGARVELSEGESARVQNEAASSLEAKRFAETRSGPEEGRRRAPDEVLAEERGVGNTGQEAGQSIRIGQVVQPPLGEERDPDGPRVGAQGQEGGVGQPPVEGRGSDGQEGGACRTTEVKKKSTRRSRGRGPWTGELVPVRRRRFLKQLMIRGDNVVMIWESPKP